MIRFRHLLVVFPALLCVVPLFWVSARTAEGPVGPDIWFLVVVSALANGVVMAYHFVIPAHPKFLMRPWRRWVLGAHILSGFIELVAGLAACFAHNATAAVIMAGTALLIHVPSALLQVPIVFGCRAIMEPAYLLCILTHAFSAAMLLAHPDSHLWAVNTFLVFNIYVWCRLYYYVFDLLKLFSAMKYSIAILAAGVTILPAVFGPAGVFCGIGFIGIYILFYRVLVIRGPREYDDFVREKARDGALPAAAARAWQDEWVDAGQNAQDAAAWFQHLDGDQDGRLDRAALLRALAPWELPAGSAERYADRLLATGPVDLERFKQDLWSIGAVRHHASHTLAIERAGSDRDKAALVFRHLDVDGDGELGRAEIDALLTGWGLPEREASHYHALAAAGDGGRMTFSVFLVHLEPIWRYVFHEIFRANYARRGNEMIGRGVTTAIETHRSLGVRGQIKRDLLQRVPFLAGADDELVGNLAASLTVERVRAGTVVIAEGEPGDRFFLVAAGLLRISRRGEIIGTLGQGSSLGEGSLLTTAPRSATVIAVEDSTLFSLTRAAFEYLTENYPHVRRHLLELHEQRRAANNTLVG